MPGPSCEFYADDDDITSLILKFDELGEFQYVETLSGLNEHLEVMVSLKSLIASLQSTERKLAYKPQYLVFLSGTPVNVHRIELTDGSGFKEAVDQYTNPDSIELRFRGETPARTIEMSDIVTIGDTRASRDLHKAFKRLVMHNTRRLGARGRPYRLMEGALLKLRAGWRLARQESAPTFTDPKISLKELASLT